MANSRAKRGRRENELAASCGTWKYRSAQKKKKGIKEKMRACQVDKGANLKIPLMANARTIWAITITQQQQQQKPIVLDLFKE